MELKRRRGEFWLSSTLTDRLSNFSNVHIPLGRPSFSSFVHLILYNILSRRVSLKLFLVLGLGFRMCLNRNGALVIGF